MISHESVGGQSCSFYLMWGHLGHGNGWHFQNGLIYKTVNLDSLLEGRSAEAVGLLQVGLLIWLLWYPHTWWRGLRKSVPSSEDRNYRSIKAQLQNLQILVLCSIGQNITGMARVTNHLSLPGAKVFPGMQDFHCQNQSIPGPIWKAGQPKQPKFKVGESKFHLR